MSFEKYPTSADTRCGSRLMLDFTASTKGFACPFGQAVTKDILEELDNDLQQQRENGMEVVAFKEHWLVTILGDIKLRRRLYQDKDGNYRFLLDEKMGLDKGSHVSPRMKKRGMSWTRQGADRMARLIGLKEMSELNAWIKCQGTPQYTPVKERIMLEEDQHRGEKDDSAWLNAGLPALHGPHYDCPRVQILRTLIWGDTGI